MSDLISMRIDSRDVMAAMLRAPRSVATHVERKLSRGALEVAREARRVAPKAFSTLRQSIRHSRISPFEFIVSPGVNYARAVEEGAKPGKMPNPDFLFYWVKKQSGVKWAKRGSAKRQKQRDEIRDRAWGLARYIKEHGTKAQPYMKPTADKMESRVIELVRQGVVDGLHAAGLS